MAREYFIRSFINSGFAEDSKVYVDLESCKADAIKQLMGDPSVTYVKLFQASSDGSPHIEILTGRTELKVVWR